MKKTYTEIIFILDESGSMYGLRSDTIGGFNSLLEKQKKEEGKAVISTVIFSDESRVIHNRADIDSVAPLSENDYCPAGCTALLDAVGGAIRHISNVHKYAREEDRPEKTLVVITTDGMENASRNFTADKVRKMIAKRQEKYGWEFIFLGANIDSVSTANNIGIAASNAVNYKADSRGTSVLFEAVSAAVSNVRACRSLDNSNADWRRSADEDYYGRK